MIYSTIHLFFLLISFKDCVPNSKDSRFSRLSCLSTEKNANTRKRKALKETEEVNKTQHTHLCHLPGCPKSYRTDLKQHTRTNLLYDLPHILALPKNSQE